MSIDLDHLNHNIHWIGAWKESIPSMCIHRPRNMRVRVGVSIQSSNISVDTEVPDILSLVHTLTYM